MRWPKGLLTILGASLLLAATVAADPAPTASATAIDTPAAPRSVRLDELLAGAAGFNGATVEVEGFYFHGFETIVLAERLEPSGLADGHLWPRGAMLWIEGNGIPREIYEQMHSQDMIGPVERYGKLRVVGRFEYGDRYGHGGGFDAQIVSEQVTLLPWTPPSSKIAPDIG